MYILVYYTFIIGQKAIYLSRWPPRVPPSDEHLRLTHLERRLHDSCELSFVCVGYLSELPNDCRNMFRISV